jgi:DNA-binding NarL/FixJ family response regulator
MRILIVDDQDEVRAQVRRVIQSKTTFKVVGEASNGAVALGIVDSLRPDVVIMGAGMPVMDGIEATSLIKDRYPGIYVLALNPDLRTREKMQEAGASGYVDRLEDLSYHLEPFHRR